MNWVDLVILALLIISVGAGFLRGFVREVIAVIAWLLGILVATHFALPLANYFTSSDSVQTTLSSASDSIGFNTAEPVSYLAIGLSFVGIFIIVLIIGKIIGYFLTSAVRMTGMGFIDGLFGGFFGFVRGVLLVTVIIFLVQLSPMAEESYWIESRLVAKFQPVVQWINERIMPGLVRLRSRAGDAWQNINERMPINNE